MNKRERTKWLEARRQQAEDRERLVSYPKWGLTLEQRVRRLCSVEEADRLLLELAKKALPDTKEIIESAMNWNGNGWIQLQRTTNGTTTTWKVPSSPIGQTVTWSLTP